MAAKLQPYPKYNPVAYDYVKSLPHGWQLLPNIALFEERKEKGTLNEQLLSISSYKGIIKSSDYEDRKDRSSEDKSEYLLVHEGDLAYNTMLMWSGAVGFSKYRGLVSPSYTVLKTKIELNPKYFHYLFRTELYKNYSKRFSYGIVDSRLRLYYTHFKRMYSIVPPLSIQNAIVDYLDEKCEEIDRFIKNKERLIELIEEQKRCIINKAITKGLDDEPELVDTGINWLGEIPVGWELKKLKYITSLIIDGAHETPTYVSEGMPFLRVTDVNEDNINWEEVRYVPTEEYKQLTKYNKPRIGDVLLSKNGTIGKVIEVTWDKPFCFFVSLCLIRFTKKMLPKYFSYFFKSDIVTDQLNEGSKTTSVTNLHLEKIKELRIAYPIIEEQQRICNFLDRECNVYDGLIKKAQNEIMSAQEFREALVIKLTTGNLSPFATN